MAKGFFTGQDSSPQVDREVLDQRSELSTQLQTNVLAAEQQATQTLDQFYQDSPMLQDIQDRTEDMLGTITSTIGDIASQAEEDEINTEALVGTLTEGFETTKNQVLSAANASARKNSFELDAYMGSAGADARSAVRRDMTETVTTELMSATQQNLATLYGGYTKNVVDTMLAGGQINAQTRLNAASSIASLTNTAANLMLGTNAAVVDSYVKTVSVANDLFKTQAGLLGNLYQIESSEYQTALSKAENINPGFYGLTKNYEAFKNKNPSGISIPGYGFLAD